MQSDAVARALTVIRADAELYAAFNSLADPRARLAFIAEAARIEAGLPLSVTRPTSGDH
jgi:hypothetical protein